jgi:BMFP domain-containing protein YqiC
MNLNPKELQKFYDLWSPMLQALPAVIEAAEREDELKRGVTILEKKLQDIQTQIAAEEARVEPVRKEVDDRIRVIREQRAEAQRGYEQYVADAKAHIAKIDEETEADVARIKAKVTVAGSELQSVEREVAAAKAKANAEAKQQKAALEAEIAELEAKKKSVEDALESLKAKIG